MLTAKRDGKAAKRFFVKFTESSGVSVKINIEKTGANAAAINELNLRPPYLVTTAATAPEIHPKNQLPLNTIIVNYHYNLRLF